MYDLFLLSSVGLVLTSPFVINLFLDAQQARALRRALPVPEIAEERPTYAMDLSPTLD